MPNNLPLAIEIADAADEPPSSSAATARRAEDIAARHPDCDADATVIAEAILEVRAAVGNA
jgi:hypothetical protein